jgi:hypothetical protein
MTLHAVLVEVPLVFADGNPEVAKRALIERARNILTTPRTEWPVAAAEAATPAAIFTGYVLPLALIQPIFMLLSVILIGRHGFFIGLLGAAATYVLELVAVGVAALIVDVLAPSFGGRKNMTQALKLVAYASTPRWIAGVFTILPGIGPLFVLLASLYALYLVYLGVPATIDVPQEKAAGFTIVTLVALCVIYALVGIFVATVIASLLIVGAAVTGSVGH